MANNKFQPLLIAIFILSAFVFIGEASVVFHEYVFHRLGMNRNFVLSILWFAPLIAAYLLVLLAKRYVFWQLIFCILFIAIVGSGSHYLMGLLGFTIDFEGWSGLKVVFKIYLLLGGGITLLGSLIALGHLKLKGETNGGLK